MMLTFLFIAKSLKDSNKLQLTVNQKKHHPSLKMQKDNMWQPEGCGKKGRILLLST
jgi:hypothetical protein